MFEQLLQLEEGRVIDVRLLIWQKHIGTWIDVVHRTSAITKHSIQLSKRCRNENVDFDFSRKS